MYGRDIKREREREYGVVWKRMLGFGQRNEFYGETHLSHFCGSNLIVLGKPGLTSLLLA